MDEFIINKDDFVNIGLQSENLFFYDVTDSTNSRAREFFTSKDSFSGAALFVAKRQTAGRGTRGRKFHSESDGGLYFSLLIDSREIDADKTASLTPLCAVAVIESLFSVIGKRDSRFFIKWVNDIWFQSRKLSGILSESVTIADGVRGYILGIGINVNNAAFDGDIKEVATSLFISLGRSFKKEELLLEITGRVLNLLREADTQELLDAYRHNMFPIGTKVRITDACGSGRDAVILGIDDDFALLLEYENGARDRVISADVSLKIK